MKEIIQQLGKHLGSFTLIVGVVSVGLACLFRFGGLFGGAGKKTIDISSSLTDSIDIAELSTSEFRYRGICEIYGDDNKTNLRGRVCYSAVVKASIDLKQVQFHVDKDKKTIKATLPEIGLKVMLTDEQNMALLPSNANIEIDTMLKCSREDVEKEARESPELMSTARDNLKAVIEGLLYPILKAQGYTLIWN